MVLLNYLWSSKIQLSSFGHSFVSGVQVEILKNGKDLGVLKKSTQPVMGWKGMLRNTMSQLRLDFGLLCYDEEAISWLILTLEYKCTYSKFDIPNVNKVNLNTKWSKYLLTCLHLVCK